MKTGGWTISRKEQRFDHQQNKRDLDPDSTTPQLCTHQQRIAMWQRGGRKRRGWDMCGLCAALRLRRAITRTGPAMPEYAPYVCICMTQQRLAA